MVDVEVGSRPHSVCLPSAHTHTHTGCTFFVCCSFEETVVALSQEPATTEEMDALEKYLNKTQQVRSRTAGPCSANQETDHAVSSVSHSAVAVACVLSSSADTQP